MVSSADYRYVANRDELLTLLLVDAYTELGDRVDAALSATQGGLEPRFLALIEDGVAAGEITPGPTTVPPPRAVAADLRRVRDEMGLALDEAVLARGVFGWSALFGAVSLEVFGQHGAGTFVEEEALFEH